MGFFGESEAGVKWEFPRIVLRNREACGNGAERLRLLLDLLPNSLLNLLPNRESVMRRKKKSETKKYRISRKKCTKSDKNGWGREI